jgi:hypothetical protein
LTAALESATVASIEVRDFNSKFLLALSVWRTPYSWCVLCKHGFVQANDCVKMYIDITTKNENDFIFKLYLVQPSKKIILYTSIHQKILIT